MLPSGPFQLVVPFEAGGGSDAAARAFAQYAAPHFDGGIDVVNRTGAGGATGFRFGADAPADGRTLTLMVASLIAGPHAVDGYAVSYRDFAPICLLATMPLVLCVRADSAMRGFEHLLAAASARPGRVTMGTAGSGSFVDLSARALAQEARVRFALRPYPGSAAQLRALVAGELDVAQVSADEALPLVQSRAVAALVVVGRSPAPALPGVPNTSEYDIALDLGFFRGLGAPHGLSPAVAGALERACAATAADPAYWQHLVKQGATPRLLAGAEFGAWLDALDRSFAIALGAERAEKT